MINHSDQSQNTNVHGRYLLEEVESFHHRAGDPNLRMYASTVHGRRKMRCRSLQLGTDRRMLDHLRQDQQFIQRHGLVNLSYCDAAALEDVET